MSLHIVSSAIVPVWYFVTNVVWKKLWVCNEHCRKTVISLWLIMKSSEELILQGLFNISYVNVYRACVCMYMYVYAHVCTYVCMYVCMYVHVCLYIYVHWASKETYHFFRVTFTEIHCIKMIHIWTQIR